jgi:hypothetical protein
MQGIREKETRKHRQRVATLKKWAVFAVKPRRQVAAVFACREESRTLFWENPNPFTNREKYLQKRASLLAKCPLAAVVVAKGRSRPFPFSPERG